ncbi:response regulator [Deinococcus radiotolerans]|uniref:DNA-binding response regulator n=1 Tax=Deinococcus radiotolerans TaxID=1309407 RepID=A0ABQ2FPU9_9DEIO|nr:response regulator transcription factor [Deinococcus radiotolerans]GGL15220.1 DNA-binding response regulator [Deinococcus radiotolerans]
MIRVMLVEDQTLVRQGLRSMLGLCADLLVVAEAEDGLQALRLVPEHRPDVMLLDYRMPHLDGLGVLRGLNALNALPPTLILTTFDDDDLLIQGAQAGARGYLLKDVSLDVLLQAVRTVAGGGRWLQPVTPSRVLSPESAPPEEAISLTCREQEVLRLMAGGYSNREIAGLITTTEGTIKSYVSNILSKLGVRDRTRAVLKALEYRLI